MDYELIVLGGDRAGRETALVAARLGYRVALVEPGRRRFGVGSGIDAELVAEAARTLVARRSGNPAAMRRPVAMHDLRRTVDELLEARQRLDADRLDAVGVDVIRGTARFTGPHTVEITRTADAVALASERFAIATGTTPSRPSWVPFDGESVFDTDDVLALERLPASMIVAGRDEAGRHLGTAFAALGVPVTLWPLENCLGIERDSPRPFRQPRVFVANRSGERVAVDAALYAGPRVGNTDHLDLEAADLAADDGGRLWCDDDFQTWIDHVFAVGEVVGFAGVPGEVVANCERAVRAAFRTDRERVILPNDHGTDFEAVDGDASDERSVDEAGRRRLDAGFGHGPGAGETASAVPGPPHQFDRAPQVGRQRGPHGDVRRRDRVLKP